MWPTIALASRKESADSDDKCTSPSIQTGPGNKFYYYDQVIKQQKVAIRLTFNMQADSIIPRIQLNQPYCRVAHVSRWHGPPLTLFDYCFLNNKN